MSEIYNQTLVLRDKEIKFRKWKGKDRKAFIKSLKNIQETQEIDEKATAEILVYNCLEDKNIVLTSEEFRYVIAQIRIASIGSTLDFNFECSECELDFNTSLELNDLVKPVFEPIQDIVVGDITIKLGNIRNKEYYDKAISDCKSDDEIYITDFIYRVHAINGNDTMTPQVLMDYFDNLDTDVLDSILDKWDTMKFKIDDIKVVKCSHCDFEEEYMFDDLTGFFPKSWFTR